MVVRRQQAAAWIELVAERSQRIGDAGVFRQLKLQRIASGQLAQTGKKTDRKLHCLQRTAQPLWRSAATVRGWLLPIDPSG